MAARLNQNGIQCTSMQTTINVHFDELVIRRNGSSLEDNMWKVLFCVARQEPITKLCRNKFVSLSPGGPEAGRNFGICGSELVALAKEDTVFFEYGRPFFDFQVVKNHNTFTVGEKTLIA